MFSTNRFPASNSILILVSSFTLGHTQDQDTPGRMFVLVRLLPSTIRHVIEQMFKDLFIATQILSPRSLKDNERSRTTDAGYF
jgi:hypothetical protein